MSENEPSKEVFFKILDERIVILESSLKMIVEGNPEGQKIARKIAHALKGSGAMYGYPELSKTADIAEHAPEATLSASSGELLALMKKIFQASPAQRSFILLLDPDENTAEAARKKLTSMGQSVVFARTAAEARNKIKDGNLLCVLMNLTLPDADGRILLRELRDEAKTVSVPIFVLLSPGLSAVKNECWQLGANDCFESPFDWDEMGSRIIAAVFKYRKLKSGTDQDFRADPPNAVANEPASPASAAASPSKRHKILLADDDELVSSIVLHRLTKEGFNVVHCDGGISAMKKINEEDFDLLILDIQMPEIDGFSILTQFRAMPRFQKVPVIMLTAMGKEEDLVRCFNLGANDYIVKPFSPIEMVARVRRALKK